MALTRDDKIQIQAMILTAFDNLIKSYKIKEIIKTEIAGSIDGLKKEFKDVKSLVGPSKDYIDKKFDDIYKKKDIDDKVRLIDGKVGGIDTRVGVIDGRVGTVSGKTDQLQKSMILIVNMEYIFALMAKEYKRAVVDIKEYTEKKDKRDYAWAIIKTGGKITVSAIMIAAGAGLVIGLNACSYGIAGSVVAGIAIPMLGALCSIPGIKPSDDAKAYIDIGSQGVSMAKDNTQNVFDTVKEIASDAKKFKTFYSGDWLDDSTLVDPHDFFLEAQVKLKRMQQDIMALDVNPQFDVKVKEYWLKSKEIAKGNMYDLTSQDMDCLLKPRDADANSKKFWKKVDESMGSYMRRFVWRNYCRSHWRETTGRYAVRVDGRHWTAREDTILKRNRPSNWPNDIWARERNLWPRHFERICADFMDRTDPKGSETHRSKMVVQCCQVQQGLKNILGLGDLTLQGKIATGGLLLDLSVIESKITDENKAGKMAVAILTAEHKNLDEETKKLLYEARTKGGANVGIIELRAGEYSSITKLNRTNGTKGIWYSPSPPAVIPKNLKVSIIMRSTVKSSNTVVVKICKMKSNVKEEDFTYVTDVNAGAWTGYTTANGFQPDSRYAEKLSTDEMKKMCTFPHNDPLVIGDRNFLTHKTQHVNLHLTEKGLFSIVLEHKSKTKHKDQRALKGAKVKGLLQGGHDLKGLDIAEDKWFFTVE